MIHLLTDEERTRIIERFITQMNTIGAIRQDDQWINCPREIVEKELFTILKDF